MKEFFDKITEFLKTNKDPHLRFSKGVDTVLQEKNSRWSFILEIENSTDSDKEIALLTGVVDSSRYAEIQDNSYKALGGESVVTPYADKTIINLKDDPRLINKIAGVTCDCVASQEHCNSSTEIAIPEQTVYKNLSGEVTISSKDFIWNFFKEFLKIGPVRVFELQVTSDNIDIFSQKLKLKEINPFIREETEYISLENYYLPDNTNELKIIVDTPFNLTQETFMSIVVPAATSLSLSFRISAYHSESNALKNKLKTDSFMADIMAAVENKKYKDVRKMTSENQTSNEL